MQFRQLLFGYRENVKSFDKNIFWLSTKFLFECVACTLRRRRQHKRNDIVYYVAHTVRIGLRNVFHDGLKQNEISVFISNKNACTSRIVKRKVTTSFLYTASICVVKVNDNTKFQTHMI